MKKILTIVSLVAVMGLTINATIACEPKPEPVIEPAPVSGGICIDCLYPSIKNANFNVSVEGNIITVNWMTTQKMTSAVYVYGENSESVATGEDAVYHTVSFPIMENGEYDLVIHSIYKSKTYTKEAGTVNITANEERSSIFDGILWAIELSFGQIDDLKKLFLKPSEEWTDIDIINWNHAIR